MLRTYRIILRSSYVIRDEMCQPLNPTAVVLWLFERSEFLIATSKKKKKTVCVCGCSANLGFSVEKIVLVLVWGT